ncbi:ORF269 [White spot syndrome virus]|nr:ORF269 [White spot syndrome virus]
MLFLLAGHFSPQPEEANEPSESQEKLPPTPSLKPQLKEMSTPTSLFSLTGAEKNMKKREKNSSILKRRRLLLEDHFWKMRKKPDKYRCASLLNCLDEAFLSILLTMIILIDTSLQ